MVSKLPRLRLLLQLILVSQLRTLNLPMDFLLTKTALIQGSPCGLIIRRHLRRYCDGGKAREWSADPHEILLCLMTRA